MKRLSTLILSLLLTLAVLPSCGDSDSKSDTQGNNPEQPNPENPDNPDDPNKPNPDDGKTTELPFAYGADPGWVTAMENQGYKFYDASGKERDCLELLKETGFNAIRLRVWVNPSSEGGIWGFCGVDDVLAKAKRAKALGYKIMVDFHYSDTWADPGKQKKPAVWDDAASLDALGDLVAEHTTSVLKTLKDADIDVTWVQVGNETRTGMMKTQSDGSETTINGAISENNSNFSTLFNRGASAAKEVYPDCKIVFHTDNGWDLGKLNWTLGTVVKSGANFDIIGVSLYPVTTENNWYAKYIDGCISNLNTLATTYNKDVMICEIGVSGIASWNGKRAIANTVIRAKNEVARCKGVFYWEPECYNSFNAYAMGGFLSNGAPSEALSAFGGSLTELLPADDPNGEPIKEENLYLYTKEGEPLGVCTPDENGVWRGTVTTTSDYLNFTAVDGKGVKYGVKDWDTWNSFAKATVTFDHFWFGGDIAKAGTYDVWFDFANGSWGGSAVSK